MSEDRTTVERGNSWYRKIVQIILLPFILPIVLLVSAILLAFGLYAFSHNLVSEFLFLARLRKCGRFLRWHQLSARIAEQGSGTLIIESPSLGWGITRAWWTPDKVLTVSPYAVPSDDEYHGAIEKRECLDWDRWQWDNHTDPQNGKGFLLRAWNGRSLEKSVRRKLPSVDVVHIWTGLVHAPNQADRS